MTNIISRGCRVVTGTDYGAGIPHPRDRVYSDVTSITLGTVRGTGLAVSSVRSVNVNMPNTIGPGANIVRCSTGLFFRG